VPGVDLVAPDRTPAPDVDLWAPLMSVPNRLGTTLATIPADVPYLAAEPDRVARWRGWLDTAVPAPALRVGLAWQGNPAIKIDAGRSVPLKTLAPLARVPGVRLVALQKHAGLDQLADWPAELPLDRPGPGFDDGPDAFLDTAALMMSLDLVVTSDTSIAHLAGGLGRPTLVMLRHAPEWRWMLDRPDSPWYPTVTLYRQARPAAWDGVVDRLAADLSARARAQGAS
jgi:hypothetical protein